MRHFDAWVIRDPYSIWHYYSTGRRWQDTVRDLIHERKICSPHPQPTPNDQVPDFSSVNPQPKSPLFTRLPAEIRQIIWSHVFGNDTLHLVQVKDKIRHVRCNVSSNPPSESSSGSGSSPEAEAATSLTHHRHCCPTTPARWRIYDGRVPGHSDRLLYPHTHEHLPHTLSNSNVALLRTCRAINAEAADLLYKNNAFDVDDLYTFIAFAQSLSSYALSSIRKLTVQYMPVWQPLSGQDNKGSIYAHTHSDALWKEFWARVASLPSLKELRLSLDLGRFTGSVVGGGAVVVSGQRLPLVLTEPWLLPLLNVRGLDAFDLAVTARCDAAAKGVIEGDLCRDAGVLRDQLRAVMCSGHGVRLDQVKGLDFGGEWLEDVFEEVMRGEGCGRQGPRLAITAA